MDAAEQFLGFSRHVLLAALIGALVGCGGVDFAREPTAPVFKALPYTWKVTVAARVQDLPQPVEVVGTLSYVEKGGLEEKPEAEKAFRGVALRYGCDAIVGIAGQVREIRSTKQVREVGVGGASVVKQKESVTTETTWSAQCVRSAAAPADATAQPRVAAKPTVSAPDPAVAPAVAADPPTSEQIKATKVVADKLLAYRDSYTHEWRNKLAEAKPEPMDVLEAMAELMFQITGPTGFWRKTVPVQWLGCPTDPTSAPCTKLNAASEEFRIWDQMQAAIAALPREEAGRFLTRNQRRLTDYVDTYVPVTASQPGMQGTLFYQANLQ